MLVAIQNRRGLSITPPSITVFSYTGSGRLQLGGAAPTVLIPLVTIPPVVRVYLAVVLPIRFGGSAATTTIQVPPQVTTRTYLPVGQILFGGAGPSSLYVAPRSTRKTRLGKRGHANPLVFYPLSVAHAGTGSGTVTSLPGAIACGLTCQASFSNGSVVQLTATPAVGSSFVQWGGDLAGATVVGPTVVITMNQARLILATFALVSVTRQLTISVVGGGLGQIATTPAGLTVGPANGSGSATFPTGQLVALTATPSPGSQFNGYAGACSGLTCSVFLDTDQSVVGTFGLIPIQTFNLAITEIGTGVGMVTSSPSGLSCGAVCTAAFAQGSLVTLTASVTPGNLFIGWSGAILSAQNPVTVLLDANKAVTATFNAVVSVVTLAITKAGAGSGSVSSFPAGITCGGTCSTTFTTGTTVLLTATPDATSSFAGWSGSIVSAANPLSVTMGTALSLTATFAATLPPPAPIVATLAVYERAGISRSTDPLEMVVPLSETDAVRDPAQLDVRLAGDVIPSQFRVLSRYGDVGDSTMPIRIAQGCCYPAIAKSAIDVSTFQVTSGGLHPTLGGITYAQDAASHHVTTGFGEGALDCVIRKSVSGGSGHNVFDQVSVRHNGQWVPLLDANNLSTYVLHGIAAQSQNADYRTRDHANLLTHTTTVEWQGTERLVLLVKTRLGVSGAEFMGSGFDARLAGFSPSTVPGALTVEARYTFAKDSNLVELDVLWKGPDGDWLHPQDAYLSTGGLRLVPNFGGVGAQMAVFDESNGSTKAAIRTHASGNTNVVYYDYAPSGTAYNFSRPGTNWSFAGATTDTVVGTEGWYAMGDAAATKWIALMHREWKANVPTGFRYDGTTLEATLWPSERGHVPSGPAYHILGGTHYYRWRGAVAFGTGALSATIIRDLFVRRLGSPLVAHAQSKWETSGALPGTAAPVGFVLGSDNHRYRALVTHTATLATKPITGASYQTVWVQDDGNIPAAAALPWVAGRRYGPLLFGSTLLNEALSRRARWALQYVDATASTDGKTIQGTYTSRNGGYYTYYGWNRYGCWIGANANGQSCSCNREGTVEALFQAWVSYGDPALLEWAERIATHMGFFASWKGANGRTGTLQFGSLALGLYFDSTFHLPEPDFNDGAERNGMSFRPLAYLYTGYQPFKDLANLALVTQYGRTLDAEQQGTRPYQSPVTLPNQTSLTGIPGGTQALGGTRLVAGAIDFFCSTFLMQGDTLSLQLARNLMVQGLIFTDRVVVGLEYAPTNTSGTLTTEGGLGTIPVGVRDNDGVQRPAYAALPAPAIRLMTQVATWAATRPAYAAIVSGDLTAMQLFVKQYAKYHLTGADGLSRNLADTTATQAVLGRPLVRGGFKSGSTVTLMGSTAQWTINPPGVDGSFLRAPASGVSNLGDVSVTSVQAWVNLLDLISYAAVLYQAEGNLTLAAAARQAARDLFENFYLYAVSPGQTSWATQIPITSRGNIVTGAETP